MTLSVCMIVKNESDVLERCLTCAADFADEIVVVDTGSTDNTKEIARRFTDKVYDFPWREDFAAARNESFSKASMDYTMWLDADDVLTSEDRAKLRQLKRDLDPVVDMVYLRYDVAFDAHDNPTLSYYRERIFKTALHVQWVGEIHEVVPQRGRAEHREISVQHRKLHPTEQGRNLRIFEKMLADGKTLDPRQQYYYARELMFNGNYPAAAAQLRAFLDEGRGWVENNINACLDLHRCESAMGQGDDALLSLLRSFTYDAPRAELCCEIGKHFLTQGRYGAAAYWYETAAARTPDEKSGAFCLLDCYGYIPYMQLCLCYDRLGDRARAKECNERAGRLKPDDPGYLYNRDYFEQHE